MALWIKLVPALAALVFVSVLVLASAPHGSLHGTYDPDCLDPNGHSFSITYDRDGHASGSVSKTCETDIALDVATFDRPAP